MNFYIKEWPDDTATLMTQDGRVVWIFPSIEEAADAAQNDTEASPDFTGADARRSLQCVRAGR